MSTRRITLKPGERQSVRARPLPGQKYTDKPILIMDPGDVVIVSHSEPAPPPEPPPPDPPPPDTEPYSWRITSLLKIFGDAPNDYSGFQWPIDGGGNTLHSQIAHKVGPNNADHRHASNYIYAPGEGNDRLSHVDENWARFSQVPHIRIEQTEVILGEGCGLILTAPDGGRWLNVPAATGWTTTRLT